MSNTADQGKATTEGASGYGETGDLAKARSYLERAEELMGKHVGKTALAHELAATAAAIGTGYAVLAQVESSVQSSFDPAAAAFFRRAAQAAEEARPHDDEPVAVHTPGPDPDGACPACRALGGDDEETGRG